MAAVWQRKVAVVLLLLTAGAVAWPGKKDDSIEAQLARWVIAKGGKLVRRDGQLQEGGSDALACLHPVCSGCRSQQCRKLCSVREAAAAA